MLNVKKRHANSVGEHLQVYDNYYGMNGLIVNYLPAGIKAG